MAKKCVSGKRMIKTPKNKIPIGLAFKNVDGHYIIEFKKSKCSEYEDVPLDSLISLVVSELEANNGNYTGVPL